MLVTKLLAAAAATTLLSAAVALGSSPDPSQARAAAAVAAAESSPLEDLLEGDDECSSDTDTGASSDHASPSCSLNHLQLRASASARAEDEEASVGATVDAQNRSMGVCGTQGYTGPASGAESCFCHKARNPVCVSKPCSCREGCHASLRQGWAGSTFENTVSRVSGCPKAFLTIPKSYVTDINNLVKTCGIGASAMLAELMAQGTEAYRSVYPKGEIVQCIHKASSVSVHWLHIHVLCKGGRVEDLPNKHSAYCLEVNNRGEAYIAASKIVSWVSAQAFKSPIYVR